MFQCNPCEFSTEKQSNYCKHLETKKHKDVIGLLQFCDEEQSTETNDVWQENFNIDGDSATKQELDDSEIFTDDYFPFANRLELLLYVLRGSKYHCIDQELFKFILHIIRVVVEDNIKSIPPFHKIWNLDIEGLELKPSVSSNKDTDKDIFYIKPSSIIEMQLSKKNTAIQLQRFPRQSNFFEGQSSGSKWKTEIKSLMAKNSSSERIYIGDNVQNGTNGECGTVVQFFSQEFENTHQVYASVKCESTRNISVIANDLLKLDQTNVYEGDDVERVQNLIEMSKQLDMDIYTVPINIFVDDTSGNRSKKWNPLSVWTLQLAGLPTSEKMKKSSHHFIGVTKPEDGSFVTPVVNDLNDMFYEGKVMYDAAYNKNVIVTSQIAVGLMDNSMASEFCHHMGAAAKENCRFCRYRNNHLLIGELRTKNKTEEILKEIENSTETSTMTGIKKKILAEEMNKAAHWDPHRDIPPDMLHCIYLGEVAILLKCMLGNCTDQQKENLQLTLNAADWKGFHHKCGENFVKYHKSSQGKDFRSFVQLAPFTVHHAGFSKEIVKLWCLLSEIVQLSNKMKLLESELTRLGDLQYQFNENIYKQFPETLKKQKIHHNLHTEQQIRLHGVPIGYTTETGESWCGIVKHFQSITNHHNANKDTALKLAHVEEVCHIIDSGTWFSNGKRVQPAQQTIEEINHPRIQTFVMGNRTQKEDEQIIGVKRNVGDEIRNMKRKDGSKLNIGEIVYFKLDDHINYGKIDCKTSSDVTVLLMIPHQEDPLFHCKSLTLTTRRKSLHYNIIEGSLFVSHDCRNGGCCSMVTNQSIRQFRHNYKHGVYLINRFKIHFNYKQFNS